MKKCILVIIITGCLVAVTAGFSKYQNSCSLLARDTVDEKKDSSENGMDTGGKDEEKVKVFGLDAGFNGSYSTGTSVSSIYYQPFFTINLNHKYVKFTVGASRFWDYQITDGNGEYDNINFTQPVAALSIYPHDVVELFGEYRFSIGDSTQYYRSHEITAGLNLIFKRVFAGASVTYAKSEYKFKPDDGADFIRILQGLETLVPLPGLRLIVAKNVFEERNVHNLIDLSFTPTVSVFVHRTTSIDIDFTFQRSGFEYFDTFNKRTMEFYLNRTGRIGFYSDVCKFMAIASGVSLGIDSEGYKIAGADGSLHFNIFDYVRISGSYGFGYYKAPDSDSWEDKLSEIISYAQTGIGSSNNPLLQNSEIGNSYFNHDVNFSITFSY